MIPLLRNLGFLDQSGAPTATYRQLKNRDSAKAAIANGVRAAYAPLFEANENAQSLPSEKLKGLVAQVAGTDDDMTARIVATFNALSKQGDFSIRTLAAAPIDDEVVTDLNSSDAEANERSSTRLSAGKGLNPQFHYNIQVHLPSNATEEVYLNIFNAIRKVFQ
jgi:hypothetical protein